MVGIFFRRQCIDKNKTYLIDLLYCMSNITYANKTDIPCIVENANALFVSNACRRLFTDFPIFLSVELFRVA